MEDKCSELLFMTIPFVLKALGEIFLGKIQNKRKLNNFVWNKPVNYESEMYNYCWNGEYKMSSGNSNVCSYDQTHSKIPFELWDSLRDFDFRTLKFNDEFDWIQIKTDQIHLRTTQARLIQDQFSQSDNFFLLYNTTNVQRNWKRWVLKLCPNLLI